MVSRVGSCGGDKNKMEAKWRDVRIAKRSMQDDSSSPGVTRVDISASGESLSDFVGVDGTEGMKQVKGC